MNSIVLDPTGFSNPSNGTNNYNYIRQKHVEAFNNNTNVVYPSNTTIYITISNNYFMIPLGKVENDFNNCTFIVTNQKHELALFKFVNNNTPTIPNITKANIKKDTVLSNSDTGVMIVKDLTTWTTRGTTPTDRYDAIYVKDGVLQNDPISTYNNTASNPYIQLFSAAETPFVFKNIKFQRTTNSTFKTYLLSVDKQINITINNVEIATPISTSLINDECIAIRNSCNISISNVTINGTYSTNTEYGYGIHLDTVYDVYIYSLHVEYTKWGVFGNFNMNKLRIYNSTINRMDVHSYGRDITCSSCTFKNESSTTHRYNRFSSFFGKLTYSYCTFKFFMPIRIDSDYHAYTPFEAEMLSCTFEIDTTCNCLLYVIQPQLGSTPRPELANFNLPNIKITNAIMKIEASVSALHLYGFSDITKITAAGGVYGLDSIIVDISKIMQKKVPLIIMTETNKVFTAHASNPVREYSNWVLAMMDSSNINFV